MKKVLVLAAVAGLMTATAAFGGSIVQSKHNLTSTGTGTTAGNTAVTSQICVYCHAPHNGTGQLPLWNRNNPAGGGFTLYSGVNMQSRQFATGFSTDSTSLFCMSCHDGAGLGSRVHNSGAIIRTGAAAGTAGRPLYNGAMDANTIFGTDLTATHPINFPVPTSNNSQADLWLSPINGGQGYMGGNTNVAFDFPLFKASGGRGGPSGNRALECGSCHAVHDSTNSPFLRYTMEGSKLCLGCHNK